jgi:23S rRNA U2552 (ribose-2'-O)-methylase RlmE/FtsJ
MTTTIKQQILNTEMDVDEESFDTVIQKYWNPLWDVPHPTNFYYDDRYEELKRMKMKIDDMHFNEKWEKLKHYFNQYEYIHVTSNKSKRHENVAHYLPLSRSFFKLWELIYDYHLIPPLPSWKSAHLAEGPGGFLESVYVYRKQHKLWSPQDTFHAITLISNKKEVPTFHKAKYLFRRDENVFFHAGKDNTGNIYHPENVDDFVEKVGRRSCHFVTGDGGIDYSEDFNFQEYLSIRLLISQIVIALQILSPHGNLVCKIFDTYLKITMDILWILTKCFKKIHIVKPVTSRPANSEKYIIGIDFQECSPCLISCLRDLLSVLYEGKYSHLHMTTLFPTFNFHSDFERSIRTYNTIHTNRQLEITKMICDLIEKGEDGVVDVKQIMKNNIKLCMEWCLKYNISINRQCKYLISDVPCLIRYR